MCACVGEGVIARARACVFLRVALLLLHAPRMRRMPAASLASLHVSTLSHKRQIFEKNVTENGDILKGKKSTIIIHVKLQFLGSDLQAG
jgi:hypothetical protein